MYLALFGLVACSIVEEAPNATITVKSLVPTATSRPTARIVEVIASPPSELAEVIPTIPLPGREVLSTEHFAFYVQDNYRPVDVTRWATLAEDIYSEVSTDLGADSPEVIILSFHPPDDRPCPVRGSVFYADSGPRMLIYADEQTEESQILGVLAHELVHIIHITGFNRPLSGDPGLNEGLATWLTREYWTAWHQTQSLPRMIRDYLAEETYVPLAEADVFGVYPQAQGITPTDCLAQRDLLYSQWAGFVGYLVDTYGWELFVDLMATAASEVTDEGEILPSPTDYEGIYGKTLETLEAEWLAQLQGSSKHVSPLADDETDGLFRFALKGCCQHLGRMHGLTSAPM